MRFWDSSALVCLFVPDQRSNFAADLLHRDQNIAVWWCTYVECCSGIARRIRQNQLEVNMAAHAMRELDNLKAAWHEIVPTESVRAHARRVVNVHPLRAGDALQLAAALEWGAGQPAEFVVFDDRLADAARREGFDVVTASS